MNKVFVETNIELEGTDGLSVEARIALDAWEADNGDTGPERHVEEAMNKKFGLDVRVVIFNSHRAFGGNGRTKATLLRLDGRSLLMVVYYPFWLDEDFD